MVGSVTSAANVGAYEYQVQSAKVGESTVSTTTAGRTNSDTVSISKSGMLASLFGDPGIEHSGDCITFDDIAASVERDRQFVQDRLGSIANDLGIDNEAAIELKRDGAGHIVVSEGTPHGDELEARLNNDEEFSRIFARLSANTSLLQAAREHIAFSREYAKNPEAAVAKYSYLFNDSRRYDFSLLFKDGTIES